MSSANFSLMTTGQVNAPFWQAQLAILLPSLFHFHFPFPLLSQPLLLAWAVFNNALTGNSMLLQHQILWPYSNLRTHTHVHTPTHTQLNAERVFNVLDTAAINKRGNLQHAGRQGQGQGQGQGQAFMCHIRS